MPSLTSVKRAIRNLPILRRVFHDRNRLSSECDQFNQALFVPPGHFYSPIPSVDEIKKDEAKIFETVTRCIAGIDLHEVEQFNLLDQFVAYYDEMPFSSKKGGQLRYYFDNPAYSYSDAILLYCMIRFLKPKRIVEVGSGFSSCVMLDTNELFFNNTIQTTFIEPYPELLRSLVKQMDQMRIQMIPHRLQDVDLEIFRMLDANDILFIDSTHICKTNSDVNRVLFEILPHLVPGVHIHFHDIFWPFEYPKKWVYEGRAWNEVYMLRAFLQYNETFRVVLMNTFMEHFHAAFFREQMPLCLKDPGGSVWIRKG